MIFLVNGVAGTKMKVCPVFFPHQANASSYCQKRRINLDKWASNITHIAANSVSKEAHDSKSYLLKQTATYR